MRECLQCQKDISDKDARAKFCSAVCKMRYHRKHGGKKFIEAQQEIYMKRILDEIEKIENIIHEAIIKAPQSGLMTTKGILPQIDFKKPTKEAYDGSKINPLVRDEAGQFQETKEEEKPPERKQGESSLDYRIRRAEWFEQNNK